MRGVVLAGAVVLGCSGLLAPARAPVDPGVSLWRAPAQPTAPAELRLEPARLVVRLGEPPVLRVRGRRAASARCRGWGGEAAGEKLQLPVHGVPGRIEVACRAGDVYAAAQVTYTDAAVLPLADPYAGGVVLFKLRRSPELESPLGSQRTGLARLDGLLGALGAHALPALPFDTIGTLDRVGLRRWVAIDIPEGVNFYQAVSLLRASADVYPESALPLDSGFVRVLATPDWPTRLVEPQPRLARQGVASTWELAAIRAPQAWERATGAGIGIAVVDGGVDLSVAPGAWILPIDVEENLRAARSSAWARAAGVVYAVVEGAGVVTCAWPAVDPDWILHDALLYAEDNCVAAVCAAGPGYPAAWAPVVASARPGVLRGGGGDLRDAWTGELHPGAALRPLRGMLLARVAGSTQLADVEVPQRARSLVRSAVSDPRDDATLAPDLRLAAAPDRAVAVGIAAGAAALVRQLRRDLEPARLRRALATGEGPLDVADALDTASGMPPGRCSSIEERLAEQALRARPVWRRVKLKVSVERGGEPDPAEPPRSDETRRPR